MFTFLLFELHCVNRQLNSKRFPMADGPTSKPTFKKLLINHNTNNKKGHDYSLPLLSGNTPTQTHGAFCIDFITIYNCWWWKEKGLLVKYSNSTLWRRKNIFLSDQRFARLATFFLYDFVAWKWHHISFPDLILSVNKNYYYYTLSCRGQTLKGN